jgi:hypothetical protein
LTLLRVEECQTVFDLLVQVGCASNEDKSLPTYLVHTLQLLAPCIQCATRATVRLLAKHDGSRPVREQLAKHSNYKTACLARASLIRVDDVGRDLKFESAKQLPVNLMALESDLRAHGSSGHDVTIARIKELHAVVLECKQSDPETAYQATDCLCLMQRTLSCDELANRQLGVTLRQLLLEENLEIQQKVIACIVTTKDPSTILLPSTSGDVELLQQTIASLIKVICWASACKVAPVLSRPERRRRTRMEMNAVRVMLSVMKSIIGEGEYVIPEEELMNICAYLLDHENDQVVLQSAEFLCERLRSRKHALLAQVPSILPGLAGLIGKLAHKHDLTKSIIQAFHELANEPDSILRSMLARQPRLLAALLEVCSGATVYREYESVALSTLLLLSEDVCNRRVLARHVGLLPCLIRVARDWSGSRGVNREIVKSCILKLAVAL